jgi:Predicted periplasmic protein (DUF2092)
MWVGADDKLPRIVHAIYLDDPDHLRHNLILSDWKLDESVSDDFFTSSKASSAKHMQFAHPNPQPAPGARPTPKAPPARTPAPTKTNPTQPQQ